MPNFRKIVSMSAVAILGATNLLTPLTYANAENLGSYDNIIFPVTAKSFSFVMPNHAVYLYAVTEPNTYYVEYDGNTHTSGSMDRSTFTYDKTGHLAPNAFEKVGYTWSKWNTKANGSGTNYASGADVFNWTEQDGGTETVYAQWQVNKYEIDYDLNDNIGTSTGSHSKQPSSLNYDYTGNIANPSRVGYTFAGWDIANMDTHPHVVGGQVSNQTSASGVMGTGFKNLNSTNNATVKFTAKWTPNTNTPYEVQHYLQGLDDNYPNILKDTDSEEGVTDTSVKPSVKTYEGFTAPTAYSGNINADGSTVFKYNYTRNSYKLTLTAGRGVKSVEGDGSVSDGGTTQTTTDLSFKYEEPVTLTFNLKAGYTGGIWSGYEESQASFNMPAQNISKTASATPIEYTITYKIHAGTVSGNPVKYTVESDNIKLNDPTRDYSVFLGWSGTDHDGLFSGNTVAIASGSIGNKTYEAVWGCNPGYHISGDSCVANDYNVEVNYNDGDHGSADTVAYTYDERKTLPNPEQSGYDFAGWTITGMSGGVEHYIGTATVTGDTYTYNVVEGATGLDIKNLTTQSGSTVIFTAIWTARDDTKYVVHHYIKDLGANTYTLSGSEELQGTTDTDVIFTEKLKSFTGFTYSGGYVNITNPETRPTNGSVTTGNIEKHGNLEIYLYYDRNKWAVTLNGDEHVDQLSGAGQYEYGSNVDVSATVKTGYHFVRWKKEITNAGE